MDNLQDLVQKLGITFTDQSLLQQAFVHSSFSNESITASFTNNERLEFLGDAILNFVAAEKIFHRFPELSEGELTEIRVQLVREETLAMLSLELNFGGYLLLGKGEEASGGRSRQSNLANVFEAFLGALYLDQGLQITKEFIIGKLVSHFNDIKPEEITKLNYKAKLQEFTQAEYKVLPVYRVLDSTGPDHDKIFTVDVSLENKTLGTGSGKNKKAAEMEAAHSACEKLNII